MPRDHRRSNVRRANVTACTRCRSRKQRCDQKLPACSNCERSGVECMSTDIDGRVAPRSYIKNLEDRVAYLETQLLSHGIHDFEAPSSGFTPLTSNSLDLSSDPNTIHELGRQPDDLVGQIPLECIQSESFTTSITGYNGLSLLRSLLADPIAKAMAGNNQSDHHALLHELPYETRASMPPKEATVRLVDTYFEHCDFFSPIISSKEDFLAMVEPLYGASTNADPKLACAKFRALVVFGTAVLLLNRRDSSVPISRSEGYFAAAIRILSQHPDSICTGDLEHLANLLLLVQHFCFSSNLTAAWHFIGLSTRLSIELNLHNERATGAQLDDVAIDHRRWLFWSTYVLERNLCTIVGRPFSIPDESISTPLPDVPKDNPRRQLAHHLLKCRRLESEIHVTLRQSAPFNGAVLDTEIWRRSMRQRIDEWFTSTPAVEHSTQLAPTDIVTGYYYNNMVLLYYPSHLLPTTSSEDLMELAQNAIKSIECYRQAFRAGKLRFYWRTVHNLFRSGVALAYCTYAATMSHDGHIDLGDADASLNSCSSILWGMVERYPRGKPYRDIFESIVSSLSKQSDSQRERVPPGEFPTSIFHDIIGFDHTGFPLSVMDSMSWEFNDSPGQVR
ncbi:unnamed protein product [Clonostachys solani]|uniref:Zn(2)-C6 fungal-type domain-containing protein n=1 Tax=Clonostachys solani TaxID=160281 RepID=A0A9P0ERZ1_9HYPO|nr:unnamed protein product [Clonostachys solani]